MFSFRTELTAARTSQFSVSPPEKAASPAPDSQINYIKHMICSQKQHKIAVLTANWRSLGLDGQNRGKAPPRVRGGRSGEIILQFWRMKDQHKNKLLEILNEPPPQTLQFNREAQNKKMWGKADIGAGEEELERAKRGQRTLVTLPAGELEHQLAVYAWRARTNQPLLAADCEQLQLRPGSPFFPPAALRSRLARSPLPADAAVTLRVQTEPSCALSAVMPLPLSQHLYCLKEAAYGLEQLHCFFGGFDPDARALRVTPEGRLKVWHSLPLGSNPARPPPEKDERRTVEAVVAIFGQWRMDSAGFRQFYEGARGAGTFLQLVRQIDLFIERNKIKIDKRVLLRQRERANRPQSPRADLARIPKFLSPSALAPQPHGGVRLSLGVNPSARRLPPPPPEPRPSLSPEKAESISLKQTTETRSPRRVNLVRTDKHRKGSDNNFCFTSLHRLEAARENLREQAKTSDICLPGGQGETMASLEPGSSLLRNVEQLFEQEELEGLSVSVEMKGEEGRSGQGQRQGQGRRREGKRLANYGRRVNESFINTHPRD